MRFFDTNPPQQPLSKPTRDIVDPEVPPEDFQKMQNGLKAFSQSVTLGRYREAQEILDDHKKDIEKYFKDKFHPAHFSIINNQALLYKVSVEYIMSIVKRRLLSRQGTFRRGEQEIRGALWALPPIDCELSDQPGHRPQGPT